MAIKRGVSLYSYQQNDFFHKMTWKDMLREVALNLNGADGIEIINEQTIPQYPMPPESFYFEWNNEMARYGLKAVTMDTYIDTLQFRDHVMTYAEAAERIKYDLRIAKKMGFSIMRLCHHTPYQSVELALPLAEELDIVMTNECVFPPLSKLSLHSYQSAHLPAVRLSIQ
jgi:sugar phosphate isomerase/epimerase